MQKLRSLIYELVQSTIAILVVVGFMLVLWWSIVHGLPEAKDGDQGMFLLIGALNTALGTILQTYFRQRDARVNDTPDNRRES